MLTALAFLLKAKHIMSKPTPVSEADLDWLRAAVSSDVTRKAMALHLGVCEDTVRRILHRNGIVNFVGSKFYSPPPIQQWNRPCTNCGCTTTRPKNQYRCDDCKSRNDDSNPFDPDIL